MSHFNYEKSLPAKLTSENVIYNYDENKNCIDIIVKSKYTNVSDDTYSFMYKNKKLIKENHNIDFGNNKKNIGTIEYSYNGEQLIKITEISNLNGKIESELFYDNNAKLSKILSHSESEKYVNIYRYFNTLDKSSQQKSEFFYDEKNNLIKVINTENNQIKYIYDYIIEYY